MKKRTISALLIIIMIISMMPAAVFAADGNIGTIPLSSKNDVYALASIVNGDADEFAYSVFKNYYPDEANTQDAQRAFLRTASFEITADMTLSSKDGFIGIGKDKNNSFAGSIDGKGHTITYDIDTADYPAGTKPTLFGLVSYLQNPGGGKVPTLENLNFTGEIKSVDCFTRCGALSAQAGDKDNIGCIINNITSSADISVSHSSAGARFGGIVCTNYGILKNVHCTANLKLDVKYKDWAMLGGIAAYSQASAIIKDSSFNGELNGYSTGSLATGLVCSYCAGSITFENIVATGDVYATAKNDATNGEYLYNGALGGRTELVTAKNIVIYDSNLYIGNETNQARVGTLIAGIWGATTLENCIVKDCDIIISGETGNDFNVGTIAGFVNNNSLTVKNVVSNTEFRLNSDIGTNAKFVGFVQGNHGTEASSEKSLFSANKAGILTAVSSGKTNNGIAGFYAQERIAITNYDSNGVAIAFNCTPVDSSKLSDLDIKWGVKNGGTITEGLPEGMNIAYDEETGQTAMLTTSNAAIGNYNLVAYVERTVNYVPYTLEMADVTVVVAAALPEVTAVTVNDGNTPVNDTLEIQALSDGKTLTAKVDTGNPNVPDTAGVVWKYYDTSNNELSSSLMGQYVTLTSDGNSLTINPELSITADYTFKVRAISVVDDEKYYEITITITKPTVTEVTFTPAEGTNGTGTENDPYVVYVGNSIMGQGAVIMNDGKAYANQNLLSSITVIVGKDNNADNHLKATVARDNSLTLTTMSEKSMLSEGKVKVTLASQTDTSKKVDFYVLMKAPVTALSDPSSDISDNKVYIQSSSLGAVIGTLSATTTVSGNVLRENGSGTEISDTTPYKEVNTVEWTSSDESIAIIDNDGKITAKGFGSVTFTVETNGVDKNGNHLTKDYTLVISDAGKTDQEVPAGLTATPTSFCDTADGKITGLDAQKKYEYRLASVATYTGVAEGATAIENLAAGEYLVRCAGNDSCNPSPDFAVTVVAGGKHEQAAPSGLTTQPASADDSADGVILGVSVGMEYANIYSSTYNSVAGIKVEGLTSGEYKVRYAETDTHNASNDVIVTIGVEPRSEKPSKPSKKPSASVTTPDAITTPDAVEATTSFSDVAATSYYAGAAEYVLEKGLMNGIGTDANGNKQFGGNMPTNRAMIVTILYRLEGEPTIAGSTSFADVDSSAYYANSVEWAAANGIVNGFPGGVYNPNSDLTREQLAAILFRYAAYKGYDVTSMAELDEFADSASVSSYAENAMAWANAVGLINGVGNDSLDPQGDAIRAHLALMLMRFCEDIAE